jgi:hypothetical protein
MRATSLLGLFVAAVCTAACENSVTPTRQSSANASDDAAPNGAGITGGGQYSLGGLPAKFSASAIQQPNGNSSGQFHQFVDEGGGVVIDVYGAVTCLAVDPVNYRGWIGGVVTDNRSTDPGFVGGIHAVGADIWFRVLDLGPGNDRLTFTGFKGSGGIQTSAEYCATEPWPADNARTWPVDDGNITVRP